MKKFFVAMMIVMTSMAVSVTEAQAKRMGGGGSFGKQSQGVSRQAPAQSSQATSAAKPGAAAIPPKPASAWKGMLGGALLGLGLGALLSSMGLGGAMASMISTMLMVGLLAAAGYFIYRMMRRKSGQSDAVRQPAFAGAAKSGYSPEIGARIDPVASGSAASMAEGSTSNAPWGVPADFDTTGFLRHTKTYFVRLQSAWDSANIADIREFTTPEMFAELRLQIQERGASANHTDVVQLDADMLGMEIVDGDHLASVKFSGMIKESDAAPAEPFNEVWNLSKPVAGQGGWVLAGIQQLS
ncbi:Tim44 domain-containing protein [Actimicrobium antarcticum]|uniref:TIM44-like domain-containing protein n=1 Tax=Actimicrobium antarcticum TaxID=1051899 RepID=A0ABP7SHN4_9BURK